MAYNNIVNITGNLGSEARIIEGEHKTFASVSIASTDSYQDDGDNWVQKETVWHDLIAFSPKVIANLKNLKKGTRITVTGTLSYRPFEVQIEDGSFVTKMQASIIAFKLELAPLVKKAS